MPRNSERDGYLAGWEARNIARPSSDYLGLAREPEYLDAWLRGWHECDAKHKELAEQAAA